MAKNVFNCVSQLDQVLLTNFKILLNKYACIFGKYKHNFTFKTILKISAIFSHSTKTKIPISLNTRQIF